ALTLATFRNGRGTASPAGQFTWSQAGAVADANIPAAAQFGGTPPANYVIQSFNHGVTLDTAAKVAGANLRLSATSSSVTVNPALTGANQLATLSIIASPTGAITLNGGTITTTGTQIYA